MRIQIVQVGINMRQANRPGPYLMLHIVMIAIVGFVFVFVLHEHESIEKHVEVRDVIVQSILYLWQKDR